MAIDETVLEAVRTKVGVETTHELGTITALMIRRYARAIGESNPLYYDAEFARSCGHADIIAPPNFVTAVSVWDEGPGEDGLRSDGVPAAALQELPADDGRVLLTSTRKVLLR